MFSVTGLTFYKILKEGHIATGADGFLVCLVEKYTEMGGCCCCSSKGTESNIAPSYYYVSIEFTIGCLFSYFYQSNSLL